MKLTDKIYNILKWVALVVLPGLGTLYTGLAETWGLPYATQIPDTLWYVCLFLGALIGVSTAEYNKEKNK